MIAANIDMAFAVVSLYFPEIKLPFLDRMLVTCEVYGVLTTIVMNKVDLYRNEAPEAVQNFIDIYTGAGYRVVQASAKTGEGLRSCAASAMAMFACFQASPESESPH